MVASCVVSPISTKKNETSVAPKAPKWFSISGGFCALSGNSIHNAIPVKDTAKIHRRLSHDTQSPRKLQSAAASPWLKAVAKRIPRIMGPGARNRDASRIVSSCVLSPISARATTPAEMRTASISLTRELNHRPPRQTPPGDGKYEEIQAGTQAILARLFLDFSLACSRKRFPAF